MSTSTDGREVTSARRVAEVVLHPVAIGALLVWILNDHVGKHAFGGWMTGKLSDVASLIAFPLIPIAAFALWRDWRGGKAPGLWWVGGWIGATGFVMATINVFDWAATGYRVGLGALQWPFLSLSSLASRGELADFATVGLTMDPTDLITLPCLVVPWLLVRSARATVRRGDASRIGDYALLRSARRTST